MHYMAKCDGDCSTYQSAKAEWFKISELGLESGSSSTWYQSEISESFDRIQVLSLTRSCNAQRTANLSRSNSPAHWLRAITSCALRSFHCKMPWLRVVLNFTLLVSNSKSVALKAVVQPAAKRSHSLVVTVTVTQVSSSTFVHARNALTELY